MAVSASAAEQSGESPDRGGITFDGRPLQGLGLTLAISPAIAPLCHRVRPAATTYIDDDAVVRVLENIFTAHEDAVIAQGDWAAVIDRRIAFQTETADELTAAIERLTRRRVVAFPSSSQTAPGVARKPFLLDAPVLTRATGSPK